MIQWATLSTEERIAAVRSNWKEGCSARDLAASIGGISRNVVIGIYARHGSKLSDTPLQAPMRPPLGAPKVPRVPKARKIATRPAGERPTPRPSPRVKVVRAPVPEPIEVRRVPLIDLEAGDCRWPVDHDGERHLFCGLRKLDGSGTAYCSHHAHRAHHAEDSL